MKIRCECGHVIYDQTDYLPGEAYLVADQDYFDLADALEEQVRKAAEAGRTGGSEVEAAIRQALEDTRAALRRYARRAIHQCSACGRLFVEDAQSQSHVFAPTNEVTSGNLLRSIEGNRWKRNLRGRWDDRHDGPDKGELWWGFGGKDEGYERHDDLETLTQTYFEVFARLQADDALRSAFLSRGAETLHQWP